MKLLTLAALTVAIFPIASIAADAPTDTKGKVSYSIGADIGGTLKKQQIDVDPAVLFEGIKDALSGGKLALTAEEMQTTMQSFQKEMMTKMQEKQKEASSKNKEAGEKFLADNKGKDGVKTTESGLQYKVITDAKGDKPKASDTVVTHYRGTTIDGKEFDSSYKRNEPAEFQLSSVIPGWTEGLQLMPVGSKFQFYVPSALAYGDNAPPEIGPAQTLIFDVELLSIKKPEPEPAAEASPTPAASPEKK